MKSITKKAAIVTANGIGDGLLFLGLRNTLDSLGFQTTLFNSSILSLNQWINHHLILPQPKDPTSLFSDYDLLFLQHDNSPKAKILEKFPKELFSFYGSYRKEKHPPFKKGYDYLCNPQKTMLENIEIATDLLFGKKISQNNLIIPPQNLIHRSYSKRVLIHPTGSTHPKRWPKERFLELFLLLEKEGLEPHWIVAPEEAPLWPSARILNTLSDLASFLYESSYMIGNDSGPAHLASLLKIPHLVIGGDGLNMPLWKTGWLQGEMITPPSFFMRYKSLRKKWDFFIKTNKVLNCFKHKVMNKL